MDARRVAVVGYPGSELLDVSCVTSTLAMANRLGAAPAYDVVLLTPAGGPVVCDSGLTLEAQGSLQRWTRPLDTLVVAGGLGHTAAGTDPLVVAHVRRLAGLSRRVASVCTGSTVLAACGLLDGRRATTHWHYADQLARDFPAVHVDPAPIYVRDGDVYTSAGVTSGLDLTLALVEEDHGPDLARRVARVLVTYLQRPGNQAQMSMFTAGRQVRDAVVRDVVDHVTSRPDADLSLGALADHAGVSPRQLSRLFVRHTGRTPARYVRRARTEAAAHLLVTTDRTVAAIARECGLGTAEALRQAFSSEYGQPPSQYRAVQRRQA
ncbi:GlxA family transcriptional regulator [Cellulosimicrobium protaetiae]|uniref:GlxA family transcriptional regulator n=1 Tax=Cellulosimicrobium protaetiae TaxID=2587808 RepID=A0A6M5UFP3_9MICO|nr:GlxA family transcriptional regulator [Cellulosimicrobium protaetiae]QJW35439.1 GlxA family transcriptional regulator [Cellulosimicrobium protaetiae]